MRIQFRWVSSSLIALWALAAPLMAAPKTTKAKSVPAVTAPAVASSGVVVLDAKPVIKDSSKSTLGDGFIAQNTLRVYLERPVSISVFNVRGQLVFRQDSERQMEIIPLTGMPTGFLYLTLRSGKYELTKKLVYTGK